MDSQIFQNPKGGKSSKAMPVHATIGVSPAIQWLSVIFLVMVVILFPERPAWGDDFDIHITPNGIKGHANEVELIDVLEVLADEGGYTFYVDKKMAETLVSFKIPNIITAEKAIGQIIQPYSHAIIFGKSLNSRVLKIEQVRIYYDNPNTKTEETQLLISEKPKLMASASAYWPE